MKEYKGTSVISYDRDFERTLVKCPICHFDYVHFSSAPVFLKGNDSYEAHKKVRGDVLCVSFWGECGHDWKLYFGFHKGSMFVWSEAEYIDYSDYIKSKEWRARAEEAKSTAGYRCQVCNRSSDEIKLNAHHRTYERLGNELPEDITVLCEECHAKFHGKER